MSEMKAGISRTRQKTYCRIRLLDVTVAESSRPFYQTPDIQSDISCWVPFYITMLFTAPTNFEMATATS